MKATQYVLICEVKSRYLMILAFVLMLLCLTSLSANTPPVVSNMTTTQRTDGTYLVDIYYDVSDADGDLLTISLEVSDDGGSTWNVDCELVSGDVGTGIISGIGKHIVWNMGTEHPNVIDTYNFKVLADDGVDDLAIGLVAYYPFDGNANDMSGYGNHGTIHGASLTADRFGSPSNAYYFNGSSYITVPHSTIFNQIEESNTLSFSAWIKPHQWHHLGNGYYFPIIDKYDSVNDFGWVLWLRGDFIVLQTIPNYFNSLTYNFALNNWYHLVLIVNPSNQAAEYYVNGSYIGCRPCNNIPQTADDLYIGFSPSGGEDYCFGVIDDLRFYNRVLSDEEISMLYNLRGQ